MPWRRAVVSARGRLHGERRLEPFEDVTIDDRVRQVLETMPWRRRAAITLTGSLHLTAGEAGRALADARPSHPRRGRGCIHRPVRHGRRRRGTDRACRGPRHRAARRRPRQRHVRPPPVASTENAGPSPGRHGGVRAVAGGPGDLPRNSRIDLRSAGRRIADSRAGCARRRHLPLPRHLGRGHGDAPRRMAGRRFDLGFGRPRVRRGDDRSRRRVGERGGVRPRAPEPGRPGGARLHADTGAAATVVRRVRRRVRTRGPAPVAIRHRGRRRPMATRPAAGVDLEPGAAREPSRCPSRSSPAGWGRWPRS